MADVSIQVTCQQCRASYWLWPDDPRAAAPSFTCRSCESRPSSSVCDVCYPDECRGH